MAPIVRYALAKLLTAGLLLSWACTGDLGPSNGGDGGEADPWQGPDGESLIPDVPTSGTIEVLLHPDASLELHTPRTVTFAAPFPKGALADAGDIQIRIDGQEVPTQSSQLIAWHPWPGSGESSSVRSAQISIEIAFVSYAPQAIALSWGEPPGLAGQAPADPMAEWIPVASADYPDGVVLEPPVYATFAPEWLSACLIRSRATATSNDDQWSWFDEAVVGYAETAVNRLPDQVTERIDFVNDFEPWLFDRALTLFGVYVRTGDVAWLREAHRAAQFYLANVGSDGYFDLKDSPDLKYSYGRSLLVDLLFTGNTSAIAAIESIGTAGSEWDPTYNIDSNFWTERHQTYALLAALAAWEATGEEAHAERVGYIAETSFAMALAPAGSWVAEGCMLHTMDSHEGAGGDVPVCSPWMSALFADAIWHYYIHSHDAAALTFLADLGQFVADVGLYVGGENVDALVPWYLVSSQHEFSDSGPWGDFEHACDVTGLLARAGWAAREIERNPTAIVDAATELLNTCRANLDYWHRPGGPDTGRSEWRLSPARKFNWWFGTTSDLPWLMSSLGQ